MAWAYAGFLHGGNRLPQTGYPHGDTEGQVSDPVLQEWTNVSGTKLHANVLTIPSKRFDADDPPGSITHMRVERPGTVKRLIGRFNITALVYATDANVGDGWDVNHVIYVGTAGQPIPGAPRNEARRGTRVLWESMQYQLSDARSTSVTLVGWGAQDAAFFDIKPNARLMEEDTVYLATTVTSFQSGTTASIGVKLDAKALIALP